MIEQTLHGLVVGLGKIHKDGSKEFQWLDKPIHNRIVSGGLDYLFTFNGSNSDIKYCPTWEGSYTGQVTHYNRWRRGAATESSTDNYNGCLQYMAVGTDGDTTSFSDTALHSQVGGYSEDVPYAFAPYNGTNFDVTTNNILLRITLQSVVMENSVTIREVGWFGKYYGQDVYPMFSRVVLPTPIDLESGERLVVCYQMHINEYEAEHDVSPLFSGLLDSDGNALKATCQRPVYVYHPNVEGWINGNYSGNGVSSNVKLIQIPYSIGTNGYGRSAPRNTNFHTVGPISVCNQNYNGVFSSNNLLIPKDPTNLVPTCTSTGAIEPDPNTSNYDIDNNSCSYTQLDYVPGSFVRDRIVTLAPGYPNFDSGYKDIYGFIYDGAVFRFGYYDTTDPEHPVWVQKPWRKTYGQSYKFTFRFKVSTVDTI